MNCVESAVVTGVAERHPAPPLGFRVLIAQPTAVLLICLVTALLERKATLTT